MVNKVILLGHVGKDPEIHTTKQGGKVARFSLATSERWTDKTTGERREKTEWHTVVVWQEGLVGVVEKFLRKGMQLYCEGTLRTRDYEAKDGVKRYVTEVVLSGFDGRIELLGKREDGRPGTAPLADAAPPREGGNERPYEDIPF